MRNKKFFSAFSSLKFCSIIVFSFSSCSASAIVPQIETQNKAKSELSPTVQNINSAVFLEGKNESPNTQKPNASDWKKYEDKRNGVSFSYPATLALQRSRSKIRLFHSIKFKHTDPCDARSKPATLNSLVDFDIAFEIAKTIVKNRSGEQTMEAGSAQEDDDFTEVGKLKGEFFWNASDGCGSYKYVYPLKKDKNLIFEQKVISIFNPAAFQYDEDRQALKHLNVITPDEEKQIIRKILESFAYN